jgi:hypothetical protein
MHTGRILIWSKHGAGETELAERLQLDGLQVNRAEDRQLLRLSLERAAGVVLLGDLPTLTDTLAVLRDPRSLVPGRGDPRAAGARPQRGRRRALRASRVEAGGDDFQPCSGSYLVLRARLAALIARGDLACDRYRLTVGSLAIDRARQEASFAGRPLVLSVTSSSCCTGSSPSPSGSNPGPVVEGRLGIPRGSGAMHPHRRGARRSLAPQAGRRRRRAADREPPRTRLRARSAPPEPRRRSLGPSAP